VIWFVVPRNARMKNKNGEETKRKGIVKRNVSPSGDPTQESRIVDIGLVNRIVETKMVRNTLCRLFEKKTNNV
jgi:hypothetical protein